MNQRCPAIYGVSPGRLAQCDYHAAHWGCHQAEWQEAGPDHPCFTLRWDNQPMVVGYAEHAK